MTKVKVREQTAIYLDLVKSTPFLAQPNFKAGCLKMAQFSFVEGTEISGVLTSV